MNFSELLTSVQCKCIVFFEDDFTQSEYRKEHALYDISRMALDDRKLFLETVHEISANLGTQLTEYLTVFDSYIDDISDWDNTVPRQDIRPALKVIGKLHPEINKALSEKYEIIDNHLLQKVYPFGARFGVGMGHPGYFDSLFDDYLLKGCRCKTLRIYTDFSAMTEIAFRTDLDLVDAAGSIVCIVDNNLSGTNRAKEIIGIIQSGSSNFRKNVIGCIFSSKQRFEEISDMLYFEYTSKDLPDGLKASIAKSAYNYFISCLKTEVIDNLSKAFSSATTNKGIAAFLSNKALCEGISEYQVIVEWIKLMCLLPKENSRSMKQLVSLSKVINSLDITDEVPDPELQKLNTLEAFDYSINDYLMPIMPGDIFTNDRGEWFVLIGQDCDTVRGEGRIPKNTVVELLPARIRKQTEYKKWTNDLEKASIFNFKSTPDAACEVLQINYQQRKYISNEIISLCAFNQDGRCVLPLSSPLEEYKVQLLPQHMVDYYEHLQKFYVSVNELKNRSANAFDIVIGQAFSPRIISIGDFHSAENKVLFDLKRVCRLTHSYVFYLYKLYLEYRGRQPFQTINLVQQEEITVPVLLNGKATEYQIKIRCVPLPDKRNNKEWPWYIEADEINRILKEIQCEENCSKDLEFLKLEDTILLTKKKLKYKKMQSKIDIVIE